MIRPTRSAPADLSIHRPGKDEIEKEKRGGSFEREGANQSVAHGALCLMIINGPSATTTLFQ